LKKAVTRVVKKMTLCKWTMSENICFITISSSSIYLFLFCSSPRGVLVLFCFFTMIGHRFPKFYNASLYAIFLKSNFWEQKSRMGCKVIYTEFITGLFSRMWLKIYIMPISRIANFHWVTILFGIEILF
jgi:hypothetical protein